MCMLVGDGNIHLVIMLLGIKCEMLLEIQLNHLYKTFNLNKEMFFISALIELVCIFPYM